MITLNQAFTIAYAYFRETLQYPGLAAASEDQTHWFFSGGIPGKLRIGSIIISVDKSDGHIELVDHLSKQGFDRIRNSVSIEVPGKFAGREADPSA